MTEAGLIISELKQLHGSKETMQTISRAIDMLEKQEPRVLTWDEVERAEVCWTERRGYEPYAELDAADWNPEYYGKAIRCWNAKPTKEQMEAVKWDE